MYKASRQSADFYLYPAECMIFNVLTLSELNDLISQAPNVFLP